VTLLVDDDHASAAIPALYTDEQKVAQILRNFVSNALKFTERGHVRVRVRRGNGDETVTFSVADTGIGVAPKDQERIFQHYEQVDSSMQRRVRGTGLGLPLSRKLARLLGGDVTLQSEVGAGSVFCLTLPIRCPTPDCNSTTTLETESASHG
jgi:signal transduction histidine kinase